MPTAAFNVTRLIAELGLKRSDAMALVERIQPVLSVGNIEDLTPPHVAPSAVFGGFEAAVAAEVFVFELQSLAPGGGFVDWVSWQSNLLNASIKVGPVAIAPGEPIVAPVGLTSRDPVVSIARQGTHVGTGVVGAIVSQNAIYMGFSPRSIFVPRGSFFSLEGGNVNITGFFGVGWREVPASEHVPS